MGAGPSVTATLVDATPYRLRYLLESTGQPGTSVLTNENAIPTPAGLLIVGVDLRFNARDGIPTAVPGMPLFELLGTAVANQAEARRLLLGEGGALPQIVNTGQHIHSDITQRAFDADNPGSWRVDADEGANAGVAASAGFGVLLITPPAAVANLEAYLDVHLKHSIDR